MTWIKYPRGGFGIGQRRQVRLCRLDVIATHRERERERAQTKMMIDDDGNDISCMCACVCLCGSVCDSVTVVALDTHHHLFSRRPSHSFFNVMLISLTSMMIQRSMIHDP